MIFILLKTYPHELSEIVGAYSTKAAADEALKSAELIDDSNGYNHFDIDEVEIQ